MHTRPMTRVDVTRYSPYGPQVTCLLNNGFRIKTEGDRIVMIKQQPNWRQRVYRFFRGRQTDQEWRDTCEVFIACLAGLMVLGAFFVVSGV